MMVPKTLTFANKNFTLFGYDADPYFQNIEQHIFTGSLIPLMVHHLRDDSTMIDVGANIGGMTALMNILVTNPKVISVEPSGAYKCLQTMVKENGFANTTCVKECVGASDGVVSFVDTGDYTGMSDRSASHSHALLSQQSDKPTLPIKKLDTIADELSLTAVDLVKIDVEGFESSVLDGMAKINMYHQPLIFMEFNSFTTSIYGKMSPYLLLQRIRNEFECFFGMEDGKLKRFSSENELHTFFFNNMTKNGCVEDIFFTSSPERRAAFFL